MFAGAAASSRAAEDCDHVHHDVVDHAPDHLVHEPAAAEVGVALLHVAQLPVDDGQIAQLVERDEAGAQAVVDVVVVVGDLVGKVGELRLEPGLLALDEPPTEVAELRARCSASSA